MIRIYLDEETRERGCTTKVYESQVGYSHISWERLEGQIGIDVMNMNDALEALTYRAYYLRCVGDRIVALISRCSDQVTDKQRAKHNRFVTAIKQIWDEAKNLSIYRRNQ